MALFIVRSTLWKNDRAKREARLTSRLDNSLLLYVQIVSFLMIIRTRGDQRERPEPDVLTRANGYVRALNVGKTKQLA